MAMATMTLKWKVKGVVARRRPVVHNSLGRFTTSDCGSDGDVGFGAVQIILLAMAVEYEKNEKSGCWELGGEDWNSNIHPIPGHSLGRGGGTPSRPDMHKFVEF